MSLAAASPIRVFLLLLVLIAQPFAAMAMDAQQVIERAISEVTSMLEKDAAAGTNTAENAHLLVEAQVLPYFDFDRMSHLILGNFWKDATDDQKARFQSDFKQLLINTYVSALSEYTSNEEIVYLPLITSSNPDVVIVPTEIHQPGRQPIPVAYRMFRQDETWRIYDVAIGGISLVMNYRASFASQIRKGGIEGLLSSLSSHNK